MSYLVRQPTKSGKIYVYQTQSSCDSTRKRSVQSKLYLGRLDSASGRLLPGRKRNHELDSGDGVAWEDVEKAVSAGGGMSADTWRSWRRAPRSPAHWEPNPREKLNT